MLIDFGVDHEIVRKSGAWYTYDGDQLGQGKENSRKFLLENPAIALDIEQKIMFKLGVGAEAKAAKATAAADALQAQALQTQALQTQKGAAAKAAKEPAGPTPIEVVPTPEAEEEFPPESEFETSLKAVGE